MTSILLFGAPKAGKSRLASELYNHLQKEGKSFFLQRLNPDCEGMWTTYTNQDLARNEKNKLKEKGLFFSEQQMQFWKNSIPKLQKAFEITIFDFGGLPSSQNKELLGLFNPNNTKAIILLKDGQDNGFLSFLKDFNPILYTYCTGLAKEILDEETFLL